jgi:hypothetical protein
LQRFVLRLPTEAGDAAIISTGVGVSGNTQVRW